MFVQIVGNYASGPMFTHALVVEGISLLSGV